MSCSAEARLEDALLYAILPRASVSTYAGSGHGSRPLHSWNAKCAQLSHGVYSAAGHGSQTADWTGEEDDGMNETICPCDFQHVSALLLTPCHHGSIGYQH